MITKLIVCLKGKVVAVVADEPTAKAAAAVKAYVAGAGQFSQAATIVQIKRKIYRLSKERTNRSIPVKEPISYQQEGFKQPSLFSDTAPKPKILFVSAKMAESA
mmetsp:Transcript_3429/g.3626  ORF Transcript_3429/g.3626 Transcript_3429/m.3626 type:complete len:104 (-) Transcript_3429:166-477(-)